MNRRSVTKLAACALAGMLAFGLAVSCSRKLATGTHPLPAEARPVVGEWLALVSRALPGTTEDSLVFLGNGRMTLGMRWVEPRSPEDPRVGDDPELEWSPDGRRWIDPNMYRDVVLGEQQPEYDADSAPVIGNAAGDSSAVFEFTGTMGRYEDARWLDSNRFLLFSFSEKANGSDRQPRWFGWYVSLYDLRDSSVATWATRDSANESQFDRYGSAVDAFVVGRLAARHAALAHR